MSIETVTAGNQKWLTWTVDLGPASAPLSSADVKVLRTAKDGTVTVEEDVTVTDSDAGGTVVAVVDFDDDLPAGRVTFRLDADRALGKPLLAQQKTFYVEPASAQRPV